MLVQSFVDASSSGWQRGVRGRGEESGGVAAVTWTGSCDMDWETVFGSNRVLTLAELYLVSLL